MDHRIEKARQLRALIDKTLGQLEDNEALEVAEFFSPWNPKGRKYAANDRVRHNGELYRCTKEHDSKDAQNPQETSQYWVKVTGSTQRPNYNRWEKDRADKNGYSVGDRIRYKGRIWECKANGVKHAPGSKDAGSTWVEVK